MNTLSYESLLLWNKPAPITSNRVNVIYKTPDHNRSYLTALFTQSRTVFFISHTETPIFPRAGIVVLVFGFRFIRWPQTWLQIDANLASSLLAVLIGPCLLRCSPYQLYKVIMWQCLKLVLLPKNPINDITSKEVTKGINNPVKDIKPKSWHAEDWSYIQRLDTRLPGSLIHC